MSGKEDAEILKMPLSRGAVFCIHFRPPVKGRIRGRMPEWSIGADCKSAGLTPYEGSNPSPTTIFFVRSFQTPVSRSQFLPGKRRPHFFGGSGRFNADPRSQAQIREQDPC